MTRYALIKPVPYRTPGLTPAEDAERTVAGFLPANYRVVGVLSDGRVLIEGEDDAGWTLDGYVLPRLASGAHYGEEALLAPTPFVGVR